MEAEADIDSGDEDDDADDDDAAMQKQRMKSSNRQASMMLAPAEVHALLSSNINTIDLNADYIGTWERVQTVNVDAVNTGNEILANSLRVVHTIDFPTSSSVHIKEANGSQITMDSVLEVGDDFKPCNVSGKKYEEKLYMEGQTLVHQRIHHQQYHEYLYKRYIEDAGKTIRLVTVFRNIATGMLDPS
jgi:hypothetical protein